MIGKSIPRADALDKVLGKAVYAGDISIDNALYIKAVRSIVAHAKLLSIDPSAALRVPGVIGVLTSEDVPGEKYYGRIKADQPVLAIDRIRFLGEAVAAVVAENEKAASLGAELVKVEYEDLEVVTSPFRALETDAPKLHRDGNILTERTLLKGDVDSALKGDVIVIRNTYRTSAIEHVYMEPDTAVAYPLDNRIIIYSSSQDSYGIQRVVAKALGVEESRIIVRRPVVGGAFGGRQDPYTELLAAIAASLYGRPAIMSLSREEVMAITVKRHPYVINYTTAARKDGRVIAVDVDIVMDKGAYASSGPAIAQRACLHSAGPYDVPNVRARVRCVYTNNVPSGPMRGFGVPQVTWAHETQMDILARQLRMDPLALRELNGLEVGSETATGQALNASVGLKETIAKVRHAYAQVSRDEPLEVPPGFVKGHGVACMYFGVDKTGISVPSTARVELSREGKARVFICVAELGQGCDQALQQIACETLGLDPEDVEVITDDTFLCPDGGITGASRLTYAAGNAVLRACKQAKELLKTQQLSADGLVRAEVTFRSNATKPDPNTGQGAPYPTYAFATQLAEVAVNPDTGEVKVLRVLAAHDVGRAINPNMVAGQVEGGVVMSTGYTLMEKFMSGFSVGLKEYLVPTAMDAPDIRTLIVEAPEPTGPYGAKAVAEPALIPTPPAITNAIYDAVGVRITQLPASPENVYLTLRQKHDKVNDWGSQGE